MYICCGLNFYFGLIFFCLVLLQNKLLLTENGENLISAQPRINTHLEKAPLKVQKLNTCKRPRCLIE